VCRGRCAADAARCLSNCFALLLAVHALAALTGLQLCLYAY
jgi:hypothetical protein